MGSDPQSYLADECSPESKCDRCGGKNVCWFCPSELWNKYARDFDILCPVCFVALAEGVKDAWKLAPEFYEDEMAHRECKARIKALEEANMRLNYQVYTPVGRTWKETAERRLKYISEFRARAEKAEGALKVAAAHNLELQEENDRLKARIAEKGRTPNDPA